MNFSVVLIFLFILLVTLCHLDPVEAGKKNSVVVINNGEGKVYYEDEGKKKKKKGKLTYRAMANSTHSPYVTGDESIE